MGYKFVAWLVIYIVECAVAMSKILMLRGCCWKKHVSCGNLWVCSLSWSWFPETAPFGIGAHVCNMLSQWTSRILHMVSKVCATARPLRAPCPQSTGIEGKDPGTLWLVWCDRNHGKIGQVYLEETMVLPCLTTEIWAFPKAWTNPMKCGKPNSQRTIFGSYHPIYCGNWGTTSVVASLWQSL